MNKLENFEPQKFKTTKKSQKTVFKYIKFLQTINSKKIKNNKLNYFKLLKANILKKYIYILSYISSFYNLIIR